MTEIGKNNPQPSDRDAIIHQGEKLLHKHEKKLSGFELKQKLKESLYRKGFAFDDIQHFIEENVD